MGWDKVQKKTGVAIDFYSQVGISTNNTIERTGAEPGDANGPVATPSDANKANLEEMEVEIHRELRGNLIIGVTPTPAPMYKHFDWGFMQDNGFGRQQNGCRMVGFDYNWSMNPSPQEDSAKRYMWLCNPQSYLDFYFPILKGVALRVGRQGDQMMINEAPPMWRMTPNLFFSHSYSFYRTEQIFGGRLDAMLFHSHQYGYLQGEFAVAAGFRPPIRITAGQSMSTLFATVPPKWIPGSTTPAVSGMATCRPTPTCTLFVPPPPGDSVVPRAMPLCTTPVKTLWVSETLDRYHLFSPNPQLMFENQLWAQKHIVSSLARSGTDSVRQAVW